MDEECSGKISKQNTVIKQRTKAKGQSILKSYKDFCFKFFNT